MVSKVINRSVESLRESWQGMIGFALALGAMQAFVGLLAAVPLERIAGASIDPADLSASDALLAAVTGLVVFAISLVLTSVLIVMVGAATRGDPPDASEAIGAVVRRAWVVLGSVVVAGVLTFIGLLIFIVPGIWFGVLMMPLLAVVLDSGEGVVASIRSTMSLVRGSWLSVFGLVLIVAGINIVVSIVGALPGLVGLFLSIIANAITSMIMATVIWFTYQELRRLRDWPEMG